MLRPTYMDLIANANKDVKEGEKPVVQSRYSIVLAAAKRARQIITEEPELIDAPDAKALSIAVNELYTDKVKILGDGN
ncbi:MAG: DNA-directed RNA polymerase subunit omega [Lachnospiraceae bacterium]|nr:DNA-directed RNA polymerase subunit omega [Lachnospiraceae bacterium]